MLELFLNNVTDEFKERLLNETRDEVYSMFSEQTINDEDKSKLEIFVVQPLYYSKLKTMSVIWSLENELSLEDIISSSTLTDSEKENILSVIANKTGIPFTSIDETYVSLMEKIFLYSSNIYNDIKNRLSDIDKIKPPIVSPKDLHFNFEGNVFTKDKFYVPFVIESMDSQYNIPDVYMHHINNDDIDRYKNLSLDKRLLSSAIIPLDIDKITTSSSSISVSVSDGENKTYAISGVIIDINIPDSIKENVTIYSNDYIGFTNNSFIIEISGPANGTITYTVVNEIDDVLSNSKFDDIETIVMHPYMIYCDVKVKRNSEADLLRELADFKNYNDFLNSINIINAKIKNPYYMPYDYKSEIKINPYTYMPCVLTPMGLIKDNSKILSSIDDELIVCKIRNIYIEETNETITI